MRVTVTLSPETEAFIHQMGAGDVADQLVQSWVDGYLGYHKDFIRDLVRVSSVCAVNANKLPVSEFLPRAIGEGSPLCGPMSMLMNEGRKNKEVSMEAARAYLDALSVRGIDLRVDVDRRVDGDRRFICWKGHLTTAESLFVKALARELHDCLTQVSA